MQPTVRRLGRYEVIGELGRGAMGVVYKAQDPELGRTVAIKTILLSSEMDERDEYEARFFQEGKAAGGLNHPNIITIHEMGREGDMAYMAMELLDGIDLRELIKGGNVSLPLALDLAAQVAEGLAYAHDQGIVHRDIKPGNIMVVRGRTAKITDFGIAKTRISDIKTQAGAVLGSPKYMSPEQAEGQRTDHRSDLFSLGVTLYELVTGSAPFQAPDLAQLMYRISSAEALPPSSIKPTLPPLLDLILAKAMAKDREARYQEARELASDLRTCKAEIESQSGVDEYEATVRLSPQEQSVQTLKVERPAGVGTAAFRVSTAPAFDSTSALQRFTSSEASSTRGAYGAAHRVLADGPLRNAAIGVLAALLTALLIAFV